MEPRYLSGSLLTLSTCSELVSALDDPAQASEMGAESGGALGDGIHFGQKRSRADRSYCTMNKVRVRIRISSSGD